MRYGYAAAITVDVAARKVEGGAEPRRSHAAVPVHTSKLVDDISVTSTWH